MELGSVIDDMTSADTIQNPGDFVGIDGLLVCGKCGTPRQHRVSIMGRDVVVPCLCQCETEKREREKQEQTEQEQARYIRNLRTQSLITGKYADATFDRYCIRKDNEKVYRLAKNYVGHFDEMSAENCGLIFFGPVGTGKSFTAACIANALLAQCKSVIMTSFVKILQDFKDKDAEEQLMQSLSRASLVILDDLGAERNTEYAQEKVYDIVDSRVRANLPMILTTNLTRKDLDGMRRADDIQRRRIYDRVLEVCYPVEFTGGSFRELKSRMQNQRMAKLME